MEKFILKSASVSGWRAEEVKRRWSDGWNGIEAQRRRQPLTEASRVWRFQTKRERAGRIVTWDEAKSAKASHGTSGLLVRAYRV